MLFRIGKWSSNNEVLRYLMVCVLCCKWLGMFNLSMGVVYFMLYVNPKWTLIGGTVLFPSRNAIPNFVNACSSLFFKFVWNPLVLNGSCAILSAGKPRGLCVTIGVNQRPGLATMSQCCELGELPLKTNSCWIGIGWEYNGNTMGYTLYYMGLE